MKKVYLLAYSDTFGSRDQVKSAINAIPEITTWRYDLPHAFYLVSEASAQALAIKLREKRGAGRFVVTEIPETNRWGWLTNQSWYLLKHKKTKA